MRQFRHVVWRQLVPFEPDQRDGMHRSSVNILESAAKVFPPVRKEAPFSQQYLLTIPSCTMP
jgi:hypothetical protein